MKTNISIRLVLFTDYGPAGHRLQRGPVLPVQEFNFPDTVAGRKQATAAAAELQDYCDTHHDAPKRGRN